MSSSPWLTSSTDPHQATDLKKKKLRAAWVFQHQWKLTPPRGRKPREPPTAICLQLRGRSGLCSLTLKDIEASSHLPLNPDSGSSSRLVLSPYIYSQHEVLSFSLWPTQMPVVSLCSPCEGRVFAKVFYKNLWCCNLFFFFLTSLLQTGWCGQQEHSPAGLTRLKLLGNTPTCRAVGFDSRIQMCVFQCWGSPFRKHSLEILGKNQPRLL